MAFIRIDYADPINRSLKVVINGKIKDYTFRRMQNWVNKWDDPIATIRNSHRYRQTYLDNYRFLIAAKYSLQLSYLLEGLTDCVEMMEKVQAMDKDDPYRKSFAWETKCLFFAYFDFCEPKPARKMKISERLLGVVGYEDEV